MAEQRILAITILRIETAIRSDIVSESGQPIPALVLHTKELGRMVLQVNVESLPAFREAIDSLQAAFAKPQGRS
jgi:hypothetical protein